MEIMTWTKDFSLSPKYLFSLVPESIKPLGTQDSLGFWWGIWRFLYFKILIFLNVHAGLMMKNLIFLVAPWIPQPNSTCWSSTDTWDLSPCPLPKIRAWIILSDFLQTPLLFLQFHGTTTTRTPPNPKKTNPEIKTQLVFNSSFALWKRNQPCIASSGLQLEIFLPLNIFWLQPRQLRLAEVCHNLILFLFSDLLAL